MRCGDGAIWEAGRRGHAASLNGSGAYVALPDFSLYRGALSGAQIASLMNS
jgi:hypothetical protein